MFTVQGILNGTMRGVIGNARRFRKLHRQLRRRSLDEPNRDLRDALRTGDFYWFSREQQSAGANPNGDRPCEPAKVRRCRVGRNGFDP